MGTYSLIIDGGTTHVRLMLLDGDGTLLCADKREAGVAQTAVAGHNRQLIGAVAQGVAALLCHHRLAAADIGRCIAYGMITSAEGLVEIPHCIAPAGIGHLHEAMVSRVFPEIAPFALAFIPGVRNFAGPVGRDNFARMDMMRGEETEAMGLFALLDPGQDCLFVLPGSHNKFIRMDAAGRILGCQTTLSGELLGALTRHTILAGAVDHSFATAQGYDPEMALAGFFEAEHAGIGRAAFAGRILSTLGKLPPEKIASYLLGAVLQTDVQALRTLRQDGMPLYIAGKEPVQTALADVCAAAGFADVVPVDAGIAGRMGIEGALRIAAAQ